jgi:hypothetical protein
MTSFLLLSPDALLSIHVACPMLGGANGVLIQNLFLSLIAHSV